MPRFFKPSSRSDSSRETSDSFIPKILESGEVKTLLSWEAPSRPFRKKDRSYYTTIVILAILLATIAFLIREFLLIGTILAFAFVTYVLAFIQPENITFKISTQGVTVGDHFYFWHELESFWYKTADGQRVLHIQTRLRYPAQLMLVLGGADEIQMTKIIARFLPYHEIPRTTIIDRWAEGLQKHFPLENPHASVSTKDDGCSTC